MRQIATVNALRNESNEIWLTFYKVLEEDIEREPSGSLSSLLGGDVFIVECCEDLAKVLWDHRTSIMDISRPKHFDYEDRTENFAFVANMTNNAGGPTYVIPKEFWQTCNFLSTP
jgi:hypothetical protein